MPVKRQLYPAISEADQSESLRRDLFPAVVRPRNFLLLWLLLLVLLGGLAVTALAYRLATGL
jgi:hypothetical protein